MQYICLHKEIALQCALRYNFAVLWPARFLNLRVKVPFLPTLFLRKFSDSHRKTTFRQAKI